jgi:peptidoglycan/LPS O-acetylase OafA/YrhL
MGIPAGRRPRFVQLDALRGIAALLVVYAHAVGFRLALEPAPSTYRVWHLLSWGTVGVAAFFCISGFVIPYSFGQSARPARGFVISRIARLYPAYWCSIVLAVVAWHAASRPGMPMIAVLANTTMVQRFLGQPDVLGVYWTLLIELTFYAVCLLAFLAGCLRSNLFLSLGALLFLVVAGAAVAEESGAAIPSLSLSLMLLACLWRRVVIERDRRAAALVIPCIAAWLLTLLVTADRIHTDARAWILGVVLFTVSTVLPVRVPAILAGLGTVSYGLYLYHELVSGAVKRLLPAWANAPYPGFFFTALGSIGLAALSYKFLEHPCIRFGKALAEQPGGDSVPPSSPEDPPRALMDSTRGSPAGSFVATRAVDG